MSALVLNGDARCLPLADGSAQCCVTSPPYYGLRDYGVGGQIGLEQTPADYVAAMVAVFREVRRVLRDDGVAWLNLGDSYSSSPSNSHSGAPAFKERQDGCKRNAELWQTSHAGGGRQDRSSWGFAPKQLLGIPWRVAFALQDDGWVLRSEVIWSKPNPMPESVRDRPTKSHEQLFLFAKARWSGDAPGRFAHVSDSDARWVAGLVDCEGCIVVKRCRHEGRADTFAPQVSVGSTCRAIVERIATIFSHGNILQRPGKNAQMHYWQVGNNVARDFLLRIYPFLVIKQRQARIGIRVDSLTYRRGGQKAERKQRTAAEHAALVSLWERCKACNHFGDPDLSDVPEPRYGGWADCERYYYDADAVREASANPITVARRNRTDNGAVGSSAIWGTGFGQSGKGSNETVRTSDGANLRTVWTINPRPFPGAHFATMPPELAERCIKAGTSEKGCCPRCGSPWERQAERESKQQQAAWSGADRANGCPAGGGHAGRTGQWSSSSRTKGWAPSCDCPPADPVPCLVIDPFTGAGTTGAVAVGLGRRFVGTELNPTYAAMARRRIERPHAPVERPAREDAMPLFSSA